MLSLIFLILDIWRYMEVYGGVCMDVYESIWTYIGKPCGLGRVTRVRGGSGAAAGKLMPSELLHHAGMRIVLFVVCRSRDGLFLFLCIGL